MASTNITAVEDDDEEDLIPGPPPGHSPTPKKESSTSRSRTSILSRVVRTTSTGHKKQRQLSGSSGKRAEGKVDPLQ